MNSLLNALQEGRLIELWGDNKEHALQVMAHMLEAIPSIPAGIDAVGLIMARELSMPTAIGKGWACPHARAPFNGDLLCAVGWSPKGIEYGAPDGLPVKIIVMYLVPEDQRGYYLREISLLAKALHVYPGLDKLNAATQLSEIRSLLLDLISSSRETVGPQIRARMIQLQTRERAAEVSPVLLANLVVEPVTIVTGPGLTPVVLAQDRGLVQYLDGADEGPIKALASQGVFQNGGWRVVKRSEVSYQADRTLYDCLAIKSAK